MLQVCTTPRRLHLKIQWKWRLVGFVKGALLLTRWASRFVGRRWKITLWRFGSGKDLTLCHWKMEVHNFQVRSSFLSSQCRPFTSQHRFNVSLCGALSTALRLKDNLMIVLEYTTYKKVDILENGVGYVIMRVSSWGHAEKILIDGRYLTTEPASFSCN